MNSHNSDKILYIDTAGKLAPRRQLFLKALQEKGYTISCILWDRTTQLAPKEVVGGITIQRIQLKAKYADVKASFKIFKVYLMMARYIQNQDFDIIQCGHLSLLPLALILGKVKRKKIIYETAEFTIHDFFARLPKVLSPLGKAVYFFENIFVSQVDGVICVPSKDNIYANRYSRFNKNVTVIKNVPDFSRQTYNHQEIKTLKRKYSGNKLIIFSGTINEANGAFILLDVIHLIKQSFPDALLLLAGTIQDKDKESFLKKLQSLHLEKYVELLGFVPYTSLVNYIYMSDIALSLLQPDPKSPYALTTIGNSRKFGEYMCAATPIVASDFGESSLIVKETNCGVLVDATNVNEIKDAICQLFENPDMAKQLGMNGKNAVKEYYNWNREKEKLYLAYQKVVDNSEGSIHEQN